MGAGGLDAGVGDVDAQVDAEPEASMPPPDVEPDAIPDANLCFGTGIRLCLPLLPTSPRSFAGGTLDTDASCTYIAVQQGGPDVCVITATDVMVSGLVIVMEAAPARCGYRHTDADRGRGAR